MTMQLIQTTTAGSGGAATIEFTSIPQTATDLLITVSGRSVNAVVPDSLYITVNSSSSGYANQYFTGNGSLSAAGTYGSSGIILNGGLAGGSTTSNTFSNSSIYIANYTSSSAKAFSLEAVIENNATEGRLNIQSGSWSGTTAITSIQIACGGGGNIAQYSTISLYAITKGSGGATVS